MPQPNIIPEIPRIYVNQINLHALDQFRRQFLRLDQDESIPLIPIVVSSFGGCVLSLAGFLSLIQTANKPVFTMTDSVAASAGAVIFAAGQERFISPYAHLMIHQVSSGAIGKLSDLKTDVAFSERLNNNMFALLDKFTKKRAGYFLNEIRKRGNTDWWLDAEEAKKLGLATQISVPKFLIEPGANFHVIGAQTEDQEREEERKKQEKAARRKPRKKKAVDKTEKEE